ncbi:hypothetical protein [Ornithinimicrobium kibberense]|uniref:hypothetical protein n=1 Tax=Ornithinimicrobium kibberense TaxID=282060 RepID=UPI003619D967
MPLGSAAGGQYRPRHDARTTVLPRRVPRQGGRVRPCGPGEGALDALLARLSTGPRTHRGPPRARGQEGAGLGPPAATRCRTGAGPRDGVRRPGSLRGLPGRRSQGVPAGEDALADDLPRACAGQHQRTLRRRRAHCRPCGQGAGRPRVRDEGVRLLPLGGPDGGSPFRRLRRRGGDVGAAPGHPGRRPHG